MAAPLILIEASPRSATTGAVVTTRLSGAGGSEPSFYLGQHWRRGLAGLPTIVSSTEFDGKDLGGGSVPQAMTVRWAPSSSAALAELAGLHWLDAAMTVRFGASPSPAEITSGKVIDVSTDDGVLTLSLSDPAADLKKPILTSRFAGTGGIEGPVEWQGKIKRRAWGRVWNLEGECIDAARQIYCFGDPSRQWAEFSAVRDKGANAATLTLLAWQGSIAATWTALQAAVAPQGGGVVCPSIACVKWWTQPAGSLCADIKGEIGAAYVETAPAIAERIAATVSAIPFAAGTVASAVAARPAEVGWVAADENGTAAAALDALLSDVSLMWVLDAGGIILREWAWGTPVVRARSVDVTRKATFRPVSRRRLGYRRNQHVMTRDALAGIVLATDVVFGDGSTAVNLQAAVVQAQSTADTAKSVADSAKGSANAALDALKDASGAVVPARDQIAAAKAALDAAVASARGDATAARDEAAQARDVAGQARGDAAQVRSDLAAEVQRAQGAEGTLTTSIAAVKTTADQAKAGVTDEATARANADSALADRLSITEAQLGGSRDSGLRARISTEETARATADSASANRITSLEASATSSATGTALNPNFARWAGGDLLPASWNPWDVPGNARITRSTGTMVRGSPFALYTQDDFAASSWGVVQTVWMSPGMWVVEAVVSMEQGDLSGAGVTLSGASNLDFIGDPDTAGWVGSVVGVRAFSKMVNWLLTGNVNLHAMVNWAGFGRTLQPKYLRWFYVNVRPATDGEIKAGKALGDAGTALARISSEETTRAAQDVALADRITKTEAQLGGSQGSQLQARISTEETTRAAQDVALADRVAKTEAQLGGIQGSQLQARISSEETTRAAQDAALANRASSLEASATASSSGAAANPNFARWVDGDMLPSGWLGWEMKGSARFARQPGSAVRGSPYSIYAQNDTPDVLWGIVQTVWMMPGKWVIEAVASLDQGDLSGAGVTIGGVTNLDFVGDPDTAGTVGNALGVRAWSKMIDWQLTGYTNLHGMAGWNGFGRTIGPKYMRWFYLNVRPASDGEIKAGKALGDAGNALARISAEETTRAAQDVALADRITRTEAQLAGSQGSQLQARISNEETARAAQDAALANRTSSLEATSTASSSGAALNPHFARWADGDALPASWNGWGLENGGRSARVVVNPVRGSVYAVDLRNDRSGVFWGIVQTVWMSPGKWVIEAVVSLDQGSLSGAGVTLSGIANLDFLGDPDTAGVIGSQTGVRAWSKMIDWVQGPGNVNLHAMGGWDGFGRIIDPKYMRWFYLNVRPASDGEIKAGKALIDAGTALSRITTEETTRATQDQALADRISKTEAQFAGTQGSQLQARISAEETARANAVSAIANRIGAVEATAGNAQSRVAITEAAIATLNGRTAARFEVVTVAGDNRALLRVVADANGGAGVDIGGDLRVDGNGIFSGTINPEALAIGRFVRRVSTSGGGSPNAGQSLLIASVDIGYLTPAGSYTVSLDGQMTVFAGTAFGSYESKPLTTTIVPDGGLLVRIVRGSTVLVNQLISGAEYTGGGAQSQVVPLGRQLVFDSPAADTVAGTTTLQLFAVRASSDSGFRDQGDSYSRVISGTYSGFAVAASVKWTFI